MRKVIVVSPRIDDDDTYGFKIEVSIAEEVQLDNDVKAPLREQGTLNVVLSEAEKVGEWLKDLIESTEKKMETSKLNIKTIVETIKKLASEKSYDVIFTQEHDP
jgi:nitrogen-specific signal transduction histidine kinase